MPEIKIQLKKESFLIFISVFFLFLLVGCRFFKKPVSFSNQIENKESPLINQEVKKEEVVRFLDGLAVEKGKENLLAVAAVLENLAGAPKPFFSSASIIYELPVEGGLTRFLAIFDLEELPENLGPIRSARPYFAEIAEEYKSLFIHAGGSNDVLFKLKQGFYKLFDFNEIGWQGKYFYRTNEPSPHNLYLKKESIKKFLTERKVDQEAKFEPWFFEEKKEIGELKEVKIVFSPLYSVKWLYDENKNEYYYWQNERLYKDKSNQEIRVKNLIIQYTEIKIIDELGRRKIKLDGSGKAKIFQNSQMIKGKWLKEAGRTRFYDEAGEEIKLLPGKTWVGVVSEKNQVSY